jgi:hypothetical protein
VRREVGDLKLAVEYIISGVINEWRPLDGCHFGSLKQQVQALFDDEWARHKHRNWKEYLMQEL